MSTSQTRIWISFKKHDMTIVTNPGSNVKLASGIPRLNRMLEKGVRLAIGTDGPASNNCLDMFREMFLVTGLTKLRENDASAMPAEEVLKMACVGGAYAMGLTDCDCIRKETGGSGFDRLCTSLICSLSIIYVKIWFTAAASRM